MSGIERFFGSKKSDPLDHGKSTDPTPSPAALPGVNPAGEGVLTKLYHSSSIRPECFATCNWVGGRILSYRDRYLEVEELTGVPWYVVGCIHSLESSQSFHKHLHNGDPLVGRTVHVPKGRPIEGSPPFTWAESAVDALMWEERPEVWDLESTLDFLERYNGLGYRRRGINSPYLWSMTTAYYKGKFVADGKFDPAAVSRQVGCAAVFKILELKGQSIPAPQVLVRST